MSFYDLDKASRLALYEEIKNQILANIHSKNHEHLLLYASDEDTYIRKAAYLSFGKILKEESAELHDLIAVIDSHFLHVDFKVRQTMINAAGEIGKKHFEAVEYFFDQGLFDPHHSPRNAVIGSVKKMGEMNPQAVLRWAKKYIHHPEPEIRREICHGIELRGRTHPEDVLDLLKELEFDSKKRVQTTLVHVMGQIAYKKNCLEKVLHHLKNWENKKLIEDILIEIMDVHFRYRNFSFYNQEEARKIILKEGFELTQ